ncbi:hypothetical protein ABH966_004576 [Lysinibacillus sp. RC46]
MAGKEGDGKHERIVSIYLKIKIRLTIIDYECNICIWITFVIQGVSFIL